MGLDVGEIGVGTDLSLDLKMFAAKSVGRVRDSSTMGDCIRRLEEEMGKIEVFRRELPLCARLLADVIDVMKEEVEKKGGDHKEEEEEEEEDGGDMSNWMSTAQLWTGDSGADPEKQAKGRISSAASGGAFVPFRASGAPPSLIRKEDMRYDVRMPDLSLLSPPPPPPPSAMKSSSPPVADESRRHAHAVGFGQAAASAAAAMAPSGTSLSLQAQSQTAAQQQQQARKARRCWSPELHRKFVAALQQLGGPQVATPKQIRELMKVDGLTNDEVKSHLQKYRLHNRRMPGTAMVNQPIVLMGGLWIPPEHSSSQSGSPEGPLHFSASGIAGSSAATVSCEEEDGRSESYGWK